MMTSGNGAQSVDSAAGASQSPDAAGGVLPFGRSPFADGQWARTILNGVGDALMATDASGRILFMNPAAEHLTGWSAAEAEGRPLGDVFCVVDERTRTRIGNPVDSVLATGGTVYLKGCPILVAKDGTESCIDDSAAPIRDATDSIIGIVLIFRDITARRSAEKALAHQAVHDSLTGLPNRLLFMDRLEQALARARRHESHRLAVLYLDLDLFKVINDNLGHVAGDELLVTIGRRIQECLRPEDTVARMGGDEFTILLEVFENSNFAEEIAERILKAIAQPLRLAGHAVVISASVGIFVITPGEQSPEDCLRQADTALYHAKELGRNRSANFDPAMHEAAVERLLLEKELRRAIERNELVLHYQPIISLHTGDISAFEALLRWNNPRMGLLPPASFIPLAEETGLIAPIGSFVLREACRQAKLWQDAFPTEPRRTMSVNLSAIQLALPDMLGQVSRALAECGLDGSSLKLEIIETALTEIKGPALDFLASLKPLEVKIIIDDFGTGCSSLYYLGQLPIDSLKVNHALTRLANYQGRGGGIVRAVTAIARALKLEVMAEDIENISQCEQLMLLGCGQGQGFFFSEPLPAAEAEMLMSNPSPEFDERCRCAGVNATASAAGTSDASALPLSLPARV